MIARASLPPAYSELARSRVQARWPGYQQPEDFGYDFRDWVSPYTKTACTLGGIALVLQDWASADGLRGGPVPDIQEYGRTRGLRTNKVLASVLGRVFGLALADVYATNAFPFVKRGNMSSDLLFGDVVKAVRLFAAAELAIVRPTMVIAVGAVAHAALERVGIASLRVPHSAARIGNAGAHELAWRKALGRM
jgi:uracil-DNA glycosylase